MPWKSFSEQRKIIEKIAKSHDEKNFEDLLYQKNTANSRSESLQQIQKQYEGLSDSVKTLMQLMDENPETKTKLGILGILADFVSVSNKIMDSLSPVISEVLDCSPETNCDVVASGEVWTDQFYDYVDAGWKADKETD